MAKHMLLHDDHPDQGPNPVCGYMWINVAMRFEQYVRGMWIVLVIKMNMIILDEC